MFEEMSSISRAVLFIDGDTSSFEKREIALRVVAEKLNEILQPVPSANILPFEPDEEEEEDEEEYNPCLDCERTRFDCVNNCPHYEVMKWSRDERY